MQTNSEIANEVLKRVDGLAQTLGTTSEYLYRTLIKKGFMLGLLELATVIVTVLVVAWTIKQCRKTFGPAKNSVDACSVVAAEVPGVIIGCLFSLVLFIASMVNGEQIVYLGAPEAYATERVIQLMK